MQLSRAALANQPVDCVVMMAMMASEGAKGAESRAWLDGRCSSATLVLRGFSPSGNVISNCRV
jgi:hypothetical protein